jgi:integrase
MRRGEALGLQWGDVDMQGQRIAIRRAAVLVKERGKGERIVIKPPKSGRTRVIDIDDGSLRVLKARRDKLAGIRRDLAAATAYVFPDDSGGVAHPERFSRRFTAAIVRARKWLARREGRPSEPARDLLPTIRLHDLRHTNATMLLTAGVHPKVVQERLGHQTIAITMDLYSHVQPTTQARSRHPVPVGPPVLTSGPAGERAPG